MCKCSFLYNFVFILINLFKFNLDLSRLHSYNQESITHPNLYQALTKDMIHVMRCPERKAIAESFFSRQMCNYPFVAV